MVNTYRLFVIIAILLTTIMPVFAQLPADTTISYSNVVTVEGATQQQLFTRARQWLNDAFNSSKDVLQIADKETGELSGKGIIDAYVTYHILGTHTDKALANFSINIYVKDGRYKYELKDFDLAYPYPSNYKYGILTSSPTCPAKWPGVRQKNINEGWVTGKESVQKQVIILIASLEKKMKTTDGSTNF